MWPLGLLLMRLIVFPSYAGISYQACQGLADRLHHRPLLRSCKHILSRPAIQIDPALDGPHDLGRVLDLIEDQGSRMVLQKQLRVLPGVAHIDGGVENHGVPLGKAVSQQGALAHLPGTRKNRHREARHHAHQISGKTGEVSVLDVVERRVFGPELARTEIQIIASSFYRAVLVVPTSAMRRKSGELSMVWAPRKRSITLVQGWKPQILRKTSPNPGF